VDCLVNANKISIYNYRKNQVALTKSGVTLYLQMISTTKTDVIYLFGGCSQPFCCAKNEVPEAFLAVF